MANRFHRAVVSVMSAIALLAQQAEAVTSDATPTPAATESASNDDVEAGASDAGATEADRRLGYDLDDFFDEEEEMIESSGFPDPIEGANRKILRFNQSVNKWLINPISRGYDFVTPDPVKFSIRRFFKNLNAPATLANDLMQLEWKDAATTTGAFVLNSTMGVGGLLEPAKYMGLPRHRSDFGQTLAIADVASGPYLVVPFVGPTNLRDGTGRLVDLILRPTAWLMGFGVLGSLTTGSEAVVTLETYQRDLEELERSSVDFYPVLRSAYYQARMSEIWSRREHRRSDFEPPESDPGSPDEAAEPLLEEQE